MLAASIVDWAALGQVVLYAFAGTLAVTLLFTGGVLLVGEGRTPAPRLVLAGAAFAGSLALVALGLYVMLSSK
jgi:cytochrome b subunit of formate dehydrogenase